MTKMTPYQEFIHKSRYARWIEKEGRRENWDETVDRYINFFKEKCPQVDSSMFSELREAILNLEIMPSMRALMTAGKALDRDHVAGYNCSFVAVDNPRAFDETLYVLACGSGVGFSVERQFVNQLPVISDSFSPSSTVIEVADSKIGWATAFRELIALLYAGKIPKWDVSKVRPAGARLKTFGGRASGPEPLERLFKFTISLFQNASGRKLRSIECHDLMCSIADTIVVGGVRRSALLSLSNLSDDRMRHAKSGQWWDTNPVRALANNSVAFTEKPDMGAFMQEWGALYASKSGERGIINREAAKRAAVATGRRDPAFDFGVNPCAEIFLRPQGFCNLTEVVIRKDDTTENISRKVRLATILGTLQSTLTNFRYVRNVWKRNAEEERLLGVSMTGIMDNSLTNGEQDMDALAVWLNIWRKEAIEVNAEYAAMLGINPSAAITTVKPSGTVSQLVDSASGIHPRYSDYYVRTVRGDKKDPLSQMLYYTGVPAEDEARRPDDMWVFAFPVKSPEGAITRNDRSAIEQLELYKTYKKNWAEHNVSITVYVRENEWMTVGAWVYENWDHVGGISFLPHSDHSYVQAPYTEIDSYEYDDLVKEMPKINWDLLKEYEREDATTGTQELSCKGGACEVA